MTQNKGSVTTIAYATKREPVEPHKCRCCYAATHHITHLYKRPVIQKRPTARTLGVLATSEHYERARQNAGYKLCPIPRLLNARTFFYLSMNGIWCAHSENCSERLSPRLDLSGRFAGSPPTTRKTLPKRGSPPWACPTLSARARNIRNIFRP